MSHVMVKTSIIKFIFVNIVCISCLLKFPNSFFVFSKWSAGTISNTARKTIFSFSTRPEKMVFPKKIALEYVFLVLLGKIMFFFLENMIQQFSIPSKRPLRAFSYIALQRKKTRKLNI